MKEYKFCIFVNCFLVVVSILYLLLFSCRCVICDNMVVGVLSGGLVALSSFIVEYHIKKRKLLESFLRIVIFNASTFDNSLVIGLDENINDIHDDIDYVMSHLLSDTVADTQTLCELWNDSSFIFNNKSQKKRLYAIYIWYENYRREYFVLRNNLSRLCRYKNRDYYGLAFDYIVNFQQKYIRTERNEQKHECAYYDDFARKSDNHIELLQKWIYRKIINENPLKQRRYMFCVRYVS